MSDLFFLLRPGHSLSMTQWFPPRHDDLGRVSAQFFALSHHLRFAHKLDVPGNRNDLEAAHARAHGRNASQVGTWFPHPLPIIVSGGQTGVDRAALDWGLENGFATGGFCPAGRVAEDGVIPAKYPLVELKARSYPVRTRKNVAETDATLIIAELEPLEGGTALTRQIAAELGKPCLVVTAASANPGDLVAAFCLEHHVLWLNVAGPRGSTAPRVAARVGDILTKAFLSDR